ncbi:BCCT family transporter, partial [Staphylococcus epidermidis]|uniref:BCCT family transporter n=1 Tax=Staphylococcus epidermidis TaxID=1282 RepID=UPI00164322E6
FFPHLKFVLQSYTLPISHYFQHFIQYTLPLNPYSPHHSSIQQSTLFYSPYLISCSPFIATFLPTVSPPPTITEFVVRVLIIPPL